MLKVDLTREDFKCVKFEQLLMGSGEQDNISHEICTFYSNDLDKDLLLTQLYPTAKDTNVHDIIKTVQEMSVAKRAMFG